MIRGARTFGAALAAVALAGLAPGQLALAAAPRASGAPAGRTSAGFHLPYTDPGQAGLLTLCNTALQPITHGSITTKPFVWRVVSSVPAPKYLRVEGATAALFAYQPRPYTPAGAWSGSIMGAESVYSNPDHPMAQFTPIDQPLDYFTQAFPPIWDHLVELRLYLSAPGISADDLGYGAADLQISGNTWKLVAGGHASCTSGGAISRATLLHVPGASATPAADSPSSRPGHAATRRGTPSPSSTGRSTAPAGGQPTPRALADSTEHTDSDGGPLAIGLGALALVVLGTWGLWWRRRRRAGP